MDAQPDASLTATLTNEKPAPDPRDAEASLVQRWSDQAKTPDWLQKAFARFAAERKYLHTEALAEDKPNRVAVNYLYRAVLAKLALLVPENPDPVVKRVQMVEPSPGDPRAALWEQLCAFQERVADSGACVLRKWRDEEHLDDVTERMILDALTTSIVWIKTGFREDAGRDPLGRSVRHAGARDQLVRLRRMAADYEAGDFDHQDSRYAELIALSDFARDMARRTPVQPGDPRELLGQGQDGTPAPSWLVPEPRIWRGGIVSIVDPENLRFDWQRVTAPAFCHLGRWWQERVWMTRDEVRERFRLSEEEAQAIGSPWRSNDKAATSNSLSSANTDEDPADTDVDSHTRNGGKEVAVWERWDMELGQACWWVQGIPRVLERRRLDAVTRRGHPYIPFIPSPAAGRFLGLSDVTLARKEQDALNQALTDDYEMRVAAYPFYATIAGFLSPEDMKAIRQRTPNAVVELTRKVEDIRQALQKFPGEPYDPALTLPAAQLSVRNIEMMLGMPSEAMQGTNKNTEFATQAQIQADNLSAQMGRVVKAILGVQRQIYQDWIDYAFAVMGPREVRDIAGPFAEWPVFDREQIARGLAVDVVAAGTRANRRGDLEDIGKAVETLANLLGARQVALAQGLDFPVDQLAKRLASALDLRISGDLVRPAQVPALEQAAMAGAATQGGAPMDPAAQPPPARA